MCTCSSLPVGLLLGFQWEPLVPLPTPSAAPEQLWGFPPFGDMLGLDAAHSHLYPMPTGPPLGTCLCFSVAANSGVVVEGKGLVLHTDSLCKYYRSRKEASHL